MGGQNGNGDSQQTKGIVRVLQAMDVCRNKEELSFPPKEHSPQLSTSPIGHAKGAVTHLASAAM